MVAGTLDRLERLKDVDDVLVALVMRAATELGGRWRVGRGATTDEEQAALYARGRTVPGEGCTPERPMGRTVTEARNSHETAHGIRAYGACAVDLIAMNDDGTPDWTPPRYIQLGAYAKARGFEWGGEFSRLDPRTGKRTPFRDYGHLQLAGWRTVPLARPIPPDAD